MKITYTGPSPLLYTSAPSGFPYLFDPGVAQEVKKEDQQFFTNISKPEGSSFRNGNWKTILESKTKPKVKPKGGNR